MKLSTVSRFLWKSPFIFWFSILSLWLEVLYFSTQGKYQGMLKRDYAGDALSH